MTEKIVSINVALCLGDERVQADEDLVDCVADVMPIISKPTSMKLFYCLGCFYVSLMHDEVVEGVNRQQSVGMCQNEA